MVAVKKAKLLDEVNHQFNNRYAEDTEGPFQVVLVDIRSDQNLGHIHPMVVGKKFRVGGISVVNIEKQSEEKISILFNAAKDGNDFVLSKVKEIDINWFAFIPDLSLQYTGIIRDIPLEFDYDDIIVGIQDLEIKEQIVNVIRIKK